MVILFMLYNSKKIILKTFRQQEAQRPHPSPEKLVHLNKHIWSKLWLYQRMLCAKLGWNWPNGSEEEDFYTWLFCHYFSLGKGIALYLVKLEYLLPKEACVKFDWNWPGSYGEEDFYFSSMYFCYFMIIYPWKWAWPILSTNLNSLLPRML